MRVATARPRPETPPVTMARIESDCMRNPGRRKPGIFTVMVACPGEAAGIPDSVWERLRPRARAPSPAKAGEGDLPDQREPWTPPPSLPLPSQGEEPRPRARG